MPQVAVALLKIGFFVFEAVAGAAAAATLGAGAAVAIGAAVVVGGVLVAKQAMSLFEIEMPAVDTDASRQRTVKGTTEPQKIIYGEALVSGPISFIGLSGTDNSDLYQTIVLAGHELNDITDIHMDDVVITDAQINGGSSAGGNVTAGTFGPKNSNTICVIKKHLGEESQTADVLLTGPFANYTADHRGDGIAYLAMKWVLNEDSAETWEKFAPQNVKALVQGKSIYDPRLEFTAVGTRGQDTTNPSYIAYSTNPSLCVADYLTDTYLGMGIPASKIDWDAVTTAADGCDVSVSVPGGTESRFTCNGVVFATDSHQKNINKILSAMNGNLVYSNGKYIVHAGIYENPTEILNEDDLTGAISIKTSLERSDRFNTIKGLFIDPSQNHKSSEFPVVQLADAVTRDNGEILEKEVQYPMTNSSYMAQRLSNKLIQLSDQQKVISFPANLSALRITAGDRVEVSIEELNWSNKVFQCAGWTFSEDGGVNLTLREDSNTSYDDPAVNEYSTITATGVITDAFRGVPSPSGLTATPGLKSNELNWVNPGKPDDFGTIYVYASRNANFSSAIKIGETDGTQFVHDGSNKSLVFSPPVVNVGDTYTIRTLGSTNFVAMGAASNTVGLVFTATSTGTGTGTLWETLSPGDLRYYWIRAVKNVGTDAASRSNLEPNADPNTTVFATVGAVEVDWDNVADPTIGIDINNDTISINTGVANTTTGQAVATSGIEAGTTVTQGGITMNQGGSIKGGQSAYNSGTGFFLGYDSTAYKFSIGNASNQSLTFDGSNLAVTGAITASSGSFTGSVSVSNTGAIYGGTMSSFNNGSGFFLGYDTDAYKFSVGNSSTKVLTWDGDNLNVQANLVSFTTAKEQVYSSLSRLPPGVVSAARSLGSNSDYFYFDSDIDVIQPSFVVSYNLGALTSGSISGQTNSRNAIISSIKLELFYATATYSGSPGTWTLWDDQTFQSSTLGTGQPSMSDNTIVVRQFDLGGGNWETKLLTRKEYREYQQDDYYSPSFTPNNVVDDEYYLNWRVSSSSPAVEWPIGAKFIKVVATITNGTYTPYPSTGSPSITATRVVSIPGGTLFEHENHGTSIALGGQGWDYATRYLGLEGQTIVSGGEIVIGARVQNPPSPGSTSSLKFVGFDADTGTIRKLAAIEFHNGISTLSGTPDFQIYVPNAGDVLAFAGDVNFNSDVDVDGTLSINGVTVNAGAVTGPGGSNTQVQFNNNGALGGSSGLTFNDSTDTLTASNLTLTGNLDIKKTGADTIVDIRGNTSYDSVLNLRSDQAGIASEGFQIWYNNDVGDVHLHTTYASDVAAIRFHTRTSTDKATNNERFTINGNGLINITTGSLAMGGNAVITNDRSLFPTSIEVIGSYSGGSGDYTNITNAQLKIASAGAADFWRIPHFSTHLSVSGVYNYQTGKDVYWGEPADTGTYFFRGRDLVIEDGVLYVGSSVVWNAGNDGSGSGLDADLLDGYSTSTSATANTVVVREASGHIYGNYILGSYFNASSGNSSNPTIGQIWTQDTSDNYLRKSTPAHFISNLGLWTSGNDGSGSGLDADLLDGIDSLSFLRSDAADTFTGTLTMGTQVALVPGNVGRGVFGLYSPTQYQHVWGMGSAYKLADDGVSSGLGGNLYGLAWSYNPDYGYVGSNAQARAGFDHQLLLMMGGTSHTAFGRGIWTSGTISSNNQGTLWGSANDGSGSGLDADLLDGLNSAQFIRSDTQATTSASLTIGVDWSQGTYNSAFVIQGTYPSWETRGTAAQPYGWLHHQDSSGNYTLYSIAGYTGSNWTQRFTFNYSDQTFRHGSPTGNVYYHQGNDGSGSGLDADLLDGYNSSDFVGKFGNAYYQASNWIEFGGAYGLYIPTVNTAHFLPNITTNYATWRTFGSRGGYDGINFSGGGESAIMYDSLGNGGIYRQADARWHTFHNVANNCLGIGDSTTSSAYGLYDSGGGIYSTGNITAYSDRRVKENIRAIDNALATVEQMRGVYYNRIEDAEKKTVIGFIAQELNEIDGAKPLVTYAEDVDQYGVSYGNTAALLVEAIKDLSQQVKDLQAEIKEMKNA